MSTDDDDCRAAGGRPGGAGRRDGVRLSGWPGHRGVRGAGGLAHRRGSAPRRATGERHGRGRGATDRPAWRLARAGALDRQSRGHRADGGTARVDADGGRHRGLRARRVRHPRAVSGRSWRLRRAGPPLDSRRRDEGVLGATDARGDGSDAPVGVQARRRRATRPLCYRSRRRRGDRRRSGRPDATAVSGRRAGRGPDESADTGGSDGRAGGARGCSETRHPRGQWRSRRRRDRGTARDRSGLRLRRHHLIPGQIGDSGDPRTGRGRRRLVRSRGANRAVSEADVLLVVGCRLNPMDTNWQAPAFIRPDEQTIVHADVDPRNVGWVYPADVGLVGDAAETLAALSVAGGASNDWALDRASEARDDFHAPACESDATPIKPQRAVAEIEAVVDEETVVTADSGNNRFWLLYYLQTPAADTYVGSGGVGGMGWAPPAAVAAELVTDKDAIAVAGDGGFAMTLTAVETAVEYGVAPTFVVLNDASLGMVRQMDDAIPTTRFHDTDFVATAAAMGGDGERLDDPTALGPALADAKASDVPTVLDVRIDPDEEMADELASSFYESVGGLHE
ncbi:thiamine pyrophosphate-dependent enzyme [Haloarculaceae archaeon H-GB11]|nr:thiamine pyrophosphate-dependent enzyme [Haloarculaceae archaeon H-GB11]